MLFWDYTANLPGYVEDFEAYDVFGYIPVQARKQEWEYVGALPLKFTALCRTN
jgi:hypothetical protein